MILHYDVIVIGGGHAGCEAAVSAARMGAKTCLVTMDMNKIAQMSCNPAIGGIAKGQIVREADALGGQTGLVTDATSIQFRMLNRSKGAAVWSPRAQCDREKYIQQWRKTLDATDGLDIWQDQAEELLVADMPRSSASYADMPRSSVNDADILHRSPSDGQCSTAQLLDDGSPTKAVTGVRTIWGVELRAKCVVVTAGTFLNGRLHIGRHTMAGGRIAEPAVQHFSESIGRHGITVRRMKTGTPVRIDRRTVHFEDMERQDGESGHYLFSFMGVPRRLQQLPCWTCQTNPAVHETLLAAIADSPLYNGQIASIGPRYCPSIETKLVTFADKQQHPLFLEPEGEDTNEMYLNGFSSSMPMDVQLAALRHIPALRDVKVYRPGYAIEYDFFDPTQLRHTLESKLVAGLFMAGQVNGTTGYEEAACQGLMAGVNAALRCATDATYRHADSSQFVLRRDEAYIGVLIDDLVTKGVDEPYRMFTSRAEYRILLRQDNADARLTEKAYDLGLATRQRYDHWQEKREALERIIAFCEQTTVKPDSVNGALEALGTTPLREGCKIADLLARPQITLDILTTLLPDLRATINTLPNRKEEISEAAEIAMKYKGYIERERIIAEKMVRLENIRIRGVFRYNDIRQLSTEARQKLTQVDPETLAQASRIPGVSPADINVLLVMMRR